MDSVKVDIPLLKSITWSHTVLPDGSKLYWTELDNFVSFLKKHRVDTDVKALRKDVVWLEIKKYHDTTDELAASKKVTLSSAIRYMCHHSDDFQACKEFVSDLQKVILDLPCSPQYKTQTILALYKDIAANGLKTDIVENILLRQSDIPVSPTVYGDYECHFNQKEWKRILLFEWHFAKNFPSAETFTIEKLVGCKSEYLAEIRKMQSLQSTIKQGTKEAIGYNLQRRVCAERTNGIILDCDKAGKHLPSSVDATVLQCDIPGILRAVTTDCGHRCRSQSGVHVYLHLNCDTVGFMDIALIIESALQRKHGVPCCTIIELRQAAWDQFVKEDGSINRFLLHDHYLQGNLESYVTQIWGHSQENSFDDVDSIEIPEHCSTCFDNVTTPLDWRSIDLPKEWQLGVPLIAQVFLESFINQCTMGRTANQHDYIQSKLGRLYSAMDSLFTVHNRKYCGVLQEMNTNELAMNYHSVSALFRITNASGATQCLRTAENQLHAEADTELCYFNTYLRKYDLNYKSIAGDIRRPISLRDCHLVVGIDNLVRLTFHHDPVPGQGRSNQICTLPITIAGVPKDAEEVLAWHSMDCTDNHDCSCMKDTVLTRDDFNSVMINLSPEEADAVVRFNQLCTWGIKLSWDLLDTGMFNPFESGWLPEVTYCYNEYVIIFCFLILCNISNVVKLPFYGPWQCI